MSRLAAVALFAACSKEAPPPPVEPGPEAWLEAIARAKQQIEIEAPRFGDARLVGALEQLARTGVTVNILVEKATIAKDADALARLGRGGAVVRGSDTALASFVVVDGMDSAIGDTGFALQIPDLAIGRQLRALYATDWASAAGDPPPAIETTATALPLKLAARPATALPSGVVAADPLVVALVAAARAQLTVAGTVDAAVAQAVAAAGARGVKVRQLARPGNTAVVIADATHAWFASGGDGVRDVGVQIDDPVVVAKIAALLDPARAAP